MTPAPAETSPSEPAAKGPTPAPAKRPPRLRAALSTTLPLPGADPKAVAVREHFSAGVSHALAGRGEEALADFDFVTRSLSQVSDGWYNRGVALMVLGRPAEALAAFDAAIRLEDEDADSWDGRGSAMAALSRFCEAVETFDRALKLNPQHFDVWHARALAQAKMGRPQDELKSVDEMLHVDPLSTAAWRWKIELLTKMGLAKEARAAKLELYRAGKDDPALQFQHDTELAATRSAIAADWAVMTSLDGREAFLPEPARSKCMAREYATACDAADLPR